MLKNEFNRETNRPRIQKYCTARLNLEAMKFEAAANKQKKAVAQRHTYTEVKK